MISLYFASCPHCSSKNLSNIYAKRVVKSSFFFFLFLTLGNNRRVFSSIIGILNFSSQPIFESVKKKNNLEHGNIQNWNLVADLYLK